MPRRARVVLDGVPLHIIQRGNNRGVTFFADDDYSFYLELLRQLCAEHQVHLHAYCLMTNHVHLLVTPVTGSAVSVLMKHLGQCHAQRINRLYKRSGSLWEGRFKSFLVDTERYMLSCYRYIELNPVRAGMVSHPSEYVWSSYRLNACSGDSSSWLTPHESYLALGKDPHERQAAYRDLFSCELEAELVDQMRKAVNSGAPFGSNRFRREMEQAAGVRFGTGQRGRPRKIKKGQTPLY